MAINPQEVSKKGALKNGTSPCLSIPKISLPPLPRAQGTLFFYFYFQDLCWLIEVDYFSDEWFIPRLLMTSVIFNL